MQTTYVPCKDDPAPKSVSIVGCNSVPCNLVRGTNVEGRINFNAVSNARTLRPVVDVQLGSIHIPHLLPEQNACKNLVSGQCPLEKGESATYLLKMPVKKSYQKASLIIQLSLVDENNKTQVCFKIPANIVD
ncbi:Epididymal secretory protein E1 [Melipona quadrifasciata]|uniref:Epididymal secretory protein E1 n=1 Tax=Melipona quadrifasciata TaxID=166423 RepID=A0A0M9A5U3_9HYME|nr:Epididymal secretory protein E1 [Melipona quadrifasciata]